MSRLDGGIAMAGVSGAVAGQELVQGRQKLNLEGKRLAIDTTRADQEQQKIYQDRLVKNYEFISTQAANFTEMIKNSGAAARGLGSVTNPYHKGMNTIAEALEKSAGMLGLDSGLGDSWRAGTIAITETPEEIEARNPGQTLMRGDQVVGQIPPAPTPLMVEARTFFPDDGAKQLKYIEDARKKSGTNVSIVNSEETQSEKTFGQKVGEQAAAIIDDASNGRLARERIQVAKSLGENFREQGGGFGALAGKKVDLSKLLLAVGMTPETFGLTSDTDSGEALQAISNEMAMGRIGGKGGMPANQFSEADREFLLKTVPGLEDSYRAFKLKLEIADRIAQRKIEAAGIFDEARAAGKSIPDSMRTMEKSLGNKPMFTEEEKKAIGLLKRSPAAGKADFSSMSHDDLLNTDLTTLKPDQISSWTAAMNKRKESGQ